MQTPELPTQDQISDAAKHIGLSLMTGAALISMLVVPEHQKQKAIVSAQPVFAFAGERALNGLEPTGQRREREESAPHYVSYNVSQRTPGRTGKV